MTSKLRPLLAPGTRLYRLGANTVLIGSNPGTHVTLRPGTLELLRLLNGARDLDVLQRLLLREVPEFKGHVKDVIMPLVQAGAIWPQRPAQFRISAPTIHADGAASAFADRLTASFTTPKAPTRLEKTQPSWHVVISTGEPCRSSLENFVIAGITHLPIVLDEDRIHLGPLTVPNASPCLSCYDEHRRHEEPRWRALTTQFGTSILECGVAISTQYRAISTLLNILESDGGDSLLGQRISLAADGKDRTTQFGFASRCHCHLLVA